MNGRNFVSSRDQTDLYRKTVAAIRNLATTQKLDDALRAYAEATCDLELDAYVKTHGLKLSHSTCIHRLVGMRCGLVDCRPPGDDHPLLFNHDGKPYSYVSQPYGIGRKTAKEMVDFAAAANLDFHIASFPTPHFPGGVIAIEWTREGSGPGNWSSYRSIQRGK